MQSKNRRVALGIEEYLDDFARTQGAETWKQFAKAEPQQWKALFLEVMKDANTEGLFNLAGVNVWEGVTRASRGMGGATDWELLQIYQNREWWPRITWLDGGIPVPNPFA